jgi:hypothetical protein
MKVRSKDVARGTPPLRATSHNSATPPGCQPPVEGRQSQDPADDRSAVRIVALATPGFDR